LGIAGPLGGDVIGAAAFAIVQVFAQQAPVLAEPLVLGRLGIEVLDPGMKGVVVVGGGDEAAGAGAEPVDEMGAQGGHQDGGPAGLGVIGPALTEAAGRQGQASQDQAQRVAREPLHVRSCMFMFLNFWTQPVIAISVGRRSMLEAPKKPAIPRVCCRMNWASS